MIILYIITSVIATRGKSDYHIDYVPAPQVIEADKINDKK